MTTEPADLSAAHVAELKGKRAQLVRLRSALLGEVRARRSDWSAFHAVCREIAQIDQQLKSEDAPDPDAT
jgi:hypothetical protein